MADTHKESAFRPSRPETADTALLRVLEALKERPHNSVELSQPEIGGLRFGARIKELKDDGWDIITQHIEGKSYCLYTLRGRKSEDKRQISLF